MEGRRTITHVGHLQKKFERDWSEVSIRKCWELVFAFAKKKIHIAPPPTKYSIFRPRPIPPPEKKGRRGRKIGKKGPRPKFLKCFWGIGCVSRTRQNPVVDTCGPLTIKGPSYSLTGDPLFFLERVLKPASYGFPLCVQKGKNLRGPLRFMRWCILLSPEIAVAVSELLLSLSNRIVKGGYPLKRKKGGGMEFAEFGQKRKE